MLFRMSSMRVALIHYHPTQRGGAERVALSVTRGFHDAPLHTSLYDPGGTFPEFADVDVRTLPLDAISPLRHRLSAGRRNVSDCNDTEP